MREPAPSRSVSEHLQRALAGVRPAPPHHVELGAALGAVLAESITARVDIPSFANSSMDGYAVIADDLSGASPATPVVLEVVADLPAGSRENPPLRPGQAARIMTGAPVPDDADAIVPLEGTDEGIRQVVVTEVHRSGSFIREVGTDTVIGTRILESGSLLDARHLAAAAAAGVPQLAVYPRPRVAIVSTGSELTAPGDPLTRGTIYDSNGVLLAASVTSATAEVVAVGRVVDDVQALHATVADFAAIADLIVLTGGASVGAYDVVKELFRTHGSVQFWSVRMQPGKPQGFGHWVDGTPIFALPGNPVSAYVSFEAFVRPAIERMRGLTPRGRELEGIVSVGWRSPSGRRQYIPVCVDPQITGGGTEYFVSPATQGGSASHLVTSLTRADALAIVEEGTDEVRPSDRVSLLPIPNSRVPEWA